jgi:ferredoxin
MILSKVKLVTFSPTGNSKKIGQVIAKAMQKPIEEIDLTPPQSVRETFEEFKDELTIIASPVYTGRIPTEASIRLHGLKANNTPAVLVVTYGNRALEDALIELRDIVSEVGFKPIAACAFIGEHSWSTPEKPTAGGRPDKKDIMLAEEFGVKVIEKLKQADNVDDVPVVVVPGSNPYKLAIGGVLKRYDNVRLMSPYTDDEVCTRCGNCVNVCPTAAIEIEDVFSYPSPMCSLKAQVVSTNMNKCVWCFACIRGCSVGARLRRPYMFEVAEWLSSNLSDRKQPETYL